MVERELLKETRLNVILVHQDRGKEFNGTQLKYRLFINQFGFWNQMKVRKQCFSSLDIFLAEEIRVWQKLRH